MSRATTFGHESMNFWGWFFEFSCVDVPANRRKLFLETKTSELCIPLTNQVPGGKIRSTSMQSGGVPSHGADYHMLTRIVGFIYIYQIFIKYYIILNTILN